MAQRVEWAFGIPIRGGMDLTARRRVGQNGLMSAAVIWLSILTVFGTLGLFVLGVTVDVPQLEFGAGWIIAGRVPWLLLSLLWGGLALGVVSLWWGRRAPKIAVVALEIVPVVYLTWYLLMGVPAGADAIAIDVGEPFPSYALEDQDRVLHGRAEGDARSPALYIFYRGHW